jgi:hypothetical protein
MCGCGCDTVLALAGLDQQGREKQGEVESASRAANAPVADPTVGCWESLKLALHRVALERAAAVQGCAPVEPT